MRWNSQIFHPTLIENILIKSNPNAVSNFSNYEIFKILESMKFHPAINFLWINFNSIWNFLSFHNFMFQFLSIVIIWSIYSFYYKMFDFSIFKSMKGGFFMLFFLRGNEEFKSNVMKCLLLNFLWVKQIKFFSLFIL